MNAMSNIEATEMQWFAVRMKPKQNGGVRTAVVNVEMENYTNRAGKPAKRRVKGSGKKVFVPELLLRRAGFEVFLPVKMVWRVKNSFTKEKHLVAVPLLVDWMFVGWLVGEGRWLELMSFDVVAGVMGTGGRPIQIPERRVLRLMHQWGGGQLSAELHQYMKIGNKYKIGDLVRVVNGPLGGQEVRVKDIKGPSVKAVLNILGGDVELEIRADLLERFS